MASIASASAFLAAPAVAPRRAAKGLAASSSSAMRGEASAAYFDASARAGAASSSSRQQRLNVVAGNTNEGGIFSPLVIVAKNAWPGGEKEFNKFRGKAISLHSQARCPRLRPGCPWDRGTAPTIWFGGPVPQLETQRHEPDIETARPAGDH